MPKEKRAPFVQLIKDYVVRQGPQSLAVRAALSAHAWASGFRMRFGDNVIAIRRGAREMVFAPALFVQVPIMMEGFDLFFAAFYPRSVNGTEVLDFSCPGHHRYRRSGAEFYFPSVPEDDSMEAYTFKYVPKSGDIVWDAGAHAGATAYDLSVAVGPSGKVFAFEPDDCNYWYLLKNISTHGLTNVVPVKKALAGRTGPVTFQMDGTMNAGIRDFLLYNNAGRSTDVEGISLEDACVEFGCPGFIKMDIEGAEVAVIRGSADFLTKNPINFAIESYHPVDGELTYAALERLFKTIGYKVESSDKFGQMFTWATPPALVGES
jgi:FkbM family methyltransferase